MGSELHHENYYEAYRRMANDFCVAEESINMTAPKICAELFDQFSEPRKYFGKYVNMLSGLFRDVFLMRYVNNKTLEEIMQKYELTEDEVLSILKTGIYTIYIAIRHNLGERSSVLYR